MPFARKALIICIFLLGGLVSIVGIIRIHFLTQIHSDSEDPTEVDGNSVLEDSAELDGTCMLFQTHSSTAIRI